MRALHWIVERVFDAPPSPVLGLGPRFAGIQETVRRLIESAFWLGVWQGFAAGVTACLLLAALALLIRGFR